MMLYTDYSVVLVGMRVSRRTYADAELTEFVEQTGSQALTYLRNAQIYAADAELNVSLFDMPLVTQNIEHRTPLLGWIIEATSDGK